MTGLVAALIPVILLGASSLPGHAPFRSQARPSSLELVNIICESQQVAHAGYEPPPLTVLSSTFAKARQQSVWIISIGKDEAFVMGGTGAMRRFVVKRHDQAGLILVDAAQGAPAHVVTIDARDSSFVYATSGVSPAGGHGHTGRCRWGEP
jgi:hypothetical protein